MRVSLFQKSQLKVLNVVRVFPEILFVQNRNRMCCLQNQEKKKIGHIWFNTMFSCPGFCGGGSYVHGDEAFPYPEGECESKMFERNVNAFPLIF